MDLWTAEVRHSRKKDPTILQLQSYARPESVVSSSKDSVIRRRILTSDAFATGSRIVKGVYFCQLMTQRVVLIC